MKQHQRWFLPIIVFILSAVLLNACSFSVEVLTTPTAVPPTFTPIAPTAAQTEVPTILPADVSATPTLISIREDTLSMLEIFMSVDGGELPRTLAFTPDGKVLAVAGGNSEDFLIRLWDVATGQSLGTLNGHTGIVWGIAFSPDGQMLASVSSDKTAKVWDWRTGTVMKSLDFPGEAVSVSFSPDGRTLAVGGVDEAQNQIQNAAIWTFSVASWQRQFKLSEYLDIPAIAYSPDGRWLVGGGTSRNVQIWRTSDGTSVFTLNHAHQVSDIAISPDGSTIATATCQTATNEECTDGGIWLWNLITGRLMMKLKGFHNAVENVAFTADGSSLIATSRDGTLRVYATSDYLPRFEAMPPGGITGMTISSDSGLLATGSGNGQVHIWKIVYRP